LQFPQASQPANPGILVPVAFLKKTTWWPDPYNKIEAGCVNITGDQYLSDRQVAAPGAPCRIGRQDLGIGEILSPPGYGQEVQYSKQEQQSPFFNGGALDRLIRSH